MYKSQSLVTNPFMLLTTVNYLHCLVLQMEFAEEPGTVLEVDFFHANQLLPLTDEAVIQKVSHRCIDVHENEQMTKQYTDCSYIRSDQ